MYYTIGTPVSALHRESTDSLIFFDIFASQPHNLQGLAYNDMSYMYDIVVLICTNYPTLESE